MLTIQRKLWNKPNKFESQDTEHLLLLELSNQDPSDNLYKLEIHPFKPQAWPQIGKIEEVIFAYPDLRNLDINKHNQIIVNEQRIGSKLVLIIRINVFRRDVMRDEKNGEKEVIAIEIKNQQGNSKLQEVFKINYTNSENEAQTYNPEIEKELVQYQLTATSQDNDIVENHPELPKLYSTNKSSDALNLGEPIDLLTLKLEESIYAQNNWSNINVDYIDKKRASKLESLDLSDNTLTNEDLQGVEQFPNITTLIVGRNGITKLEFINNYKNLKHLTIIGKELNNYFDGDQPLISLSEFKQLREIVLIDDNLSDLDFFKQGNFQHLKRLILDHNQITDLQPISQFVGLEYLSATDNKIQNIDCLQNISSLKKLILRNNQIGNVKQDFLQLNQLTDLDLNKNKITDLRPFRVLKNLKIFQISGNPLPCLIPLQGMLNSLEKLVIFNVTLTNNISEELKKIPIIKQLETIKVNSKGEKIARNKFSVCVKEIVITESVKLSLVFIPVGEYMIVERDKRKLVKVEKFWMSQYQITQEQWKAIAKLEKIKIDLNESPSNWKGKKRPVENVNWYQAQEFCQRLSKKIGEEFRLPREAEWEYACRAGTTTLFHFGETITSELVNYNGNYAYADAPKGKFRQQTTDVGTFPPNSFGLYDMHGNVSEWCADDWNENCSPLRGGSWNDPPDYCCSACRSDFDWRDVLDNYLGFRVVYP